MTPGAGSPPDHQLLHLRSRHCRPGLGAPGMLPLPGHKVGEKLVSSWRGERASRILDMKREIGIKANQEVKQKERL